MSSAPDHEPALPVRVPRSRAAGGRHRRPESVEVPPDAPALVLAVPGAYTSDHRFLAAELAGLARAEQPGADVRYGFLEGSEDSLADALHACADARKEAIAAGGAAAVVVPLLAAPHPALEDAVRAAVAAAGVPAPVTTALGPHPLLAEALHVRLSEAGLARADRARLFAVSTAADGIVLGSVGGADAAEATEATGVLLAARLAVQVATVTLDGPEGAQAAVDAVARLRAAGVQRPVLAAGAIGPELPQGLLAGAAAAAGCPHAEPLGAYGGIGRLALLRYTAAMPEQPEAPAAPEAVAPGSGERRAHAAPTQL
ncbi:hypothetical protein BIV57_19680 [Mangrovactinospora gilvigrisea]|uniref:Cobalamin biosynthesis protein CbiX n=1 Tax=Mangrovactinospora gilvigrisea TaxID=1428644 RepID=A0A1J7BQR6_9ACTN|nr:CbiX/SirB N-terminal domain-containing protein [Mangrovactinospora gilvigrisea]OIV35793.1 hypothetical protein BIV57_19680 [Mangrovactinospora gilvigrisea]